MRAGRSAVLAGPGAARALAVPGAGRVEIALRRGGYLTVGGRYLMVVPARAPLGPLSLLVPDAPVLEPDAPVTWDGVALRAGGWAVAAAGVPVAAAGPAVECAPGAGAAMAAACAAVSPPPAQFADGLRLLRAGDGGAAAAALAGRGPGMTPAGDDVLAGWAAWRVMDGDAAAARAVAGAAGPRTTPVSGAYLECAARGELPEAAHRVAEAIRRGDAGTAARRALGLTAWGATSGVALLWGMAAAVPGPGAPRVRTLPGTRPTTGRPPCREARSPSC